uniref:WH1 domain-containing protein n=1 Tax=Syphacia muris TaxID=451379 RepID=A0A0N5AQC3_9BILA
MSGSKEHRKRDRPTNNGSRLLTDGENAIFFSLLGHDCFSLAAGIVQLLKSDPNRPRTWLQVCGGIITLVKDYGKRAYFLRYKNFQGFATICPNLLYFEGDDCVYGLNFSSRDEAENFKTHLDRRYQQEQKTRETLIFFNYYC